MGSNVTLSVCLLRRSRHPPALFASPEGGPRTLQVLPPPAEDNTWQAFARTVGQTARD